MSAFEVVSFDGRSGWVRQGHRVLPFAVWSLGDTTQVWLDGRIWEVTTGLSRRSGAAGAGAAVDSVTAAMPGKVLQVLVAEGAEVVAGQGLLVMESMKMEITVEAPRDGRVEKVGCASGDMVDRGALLVKLESVD